MSVKSEIYNLVQLACQLIQKDDINSFVEIHKNRQGDLDAFLAKDNDSVLRVACSCNSYQIIDYLVRCGYNVNQRYRDEKRNFGIVPRAEYWHTPSDAAISYDCDMAFNLLLHNGCEKCNNSIDFYIFKSVEKKSRKCIHILIDYGIDLNKCYKPGFNAMSYAMMYKSTEMINYLQELGCKLPEGFNLPSATLKAKLEPRVIQSRIIDQDGEVEFYCGHDDVMNATKFYTLGASDLAVKISSPEFEGFRFVDFFIDLPSNWPTDADSLKDPRFSWPLYWLKRLVAMRRRNELVLFGSILSNDEPPQPLGPDIAHAAFITIPSSELTTQLDNELHSVVFMQLFPLLTPERDYALENGPAKLFKAFQKADIPMVFDAQRHCAVKVAKKKKS